MAKSLRLAVWNANGIINHKEELQFFLQDQLIDVMLISESHLTDKSYLKIPGYKFYHANHPDNTAHAGSAILIKSTINHYQLHNYVKDHLQATSIRIKTLPYEITVSAIYCPPRHHNIRKQDFLDFFRTLGPKYIIGGDFNCKHIIWGSRLTTTRGRVLAKAIREMKCSPLSTGTPTYWPTDPGKVPDLLDFFLTRGISNSYLEVEPNYDLSSDHTPVIATLSTTLITAPKTPKLHTAKTNWQDYRNIIEARIQLNISLKTPEEIEEGTQELIQTLQEAAKQATPPSHTPQKRVNNIPFDIKKLVIEKRKARKKWHRSHSPMDKTIFNRLTNKLKKKLNDIRNISFCEYVSSLNRYDNSIWRPIKTSSKPPQVNPPIRKQTPSPGPWARSNQEKADLFAEYLADVFTPNDNTADQTVTDYLATNLATSANIRLLTPKQIKTAISHLTIRKAPGIDQVSPTMLKELPHKGIVMLTYIFNAILRLQYWPKQMKIAEIILIPKPGKNPNDVSSYRPISLLSTLSKLLEKLMLPKLEPLLDTIPQHQFGFRHSHSTIQQCHRVVHEINKSLENKKYCSSVFLDISQAFDKVWHDGLLYKLKLHLPSYVKLFQSYLCERQFRTKVQGATSNTFPIKSGVPQGSVLGPVLYLVYTSDLPTTENTLTGTFADDTVILASHEDPTIASARLQHHLHLLEAWTTKWKIKINETKSAQVTFTLRKDQCPPLFFNNILIPDLPSIRYLGMHMDAKLTWREHIVKKRKQIDLKFKQLYWLLGRKSPLSLENKVLVYKVAIKPIWTYGIELWGCASNSSIAILQRCQSKILRTMADAPWYVSNSTLHNDLGIPFIKEVVHERSSTHHNRLEIHPNALLQPLLQKYNTRRLKRRIPIDLK